MSTGEFSNYQLKEELTLDEAKEFFLAPENLTKIYNRQSVGRVKKENLKDLKFS